MRAGGNGQSNGKPAHPAADSWPGRLPERATFDLALDAHLLTDAHGVILDANLPAAQLLQCPPDFLRGKPLGLFVAPPDRAAFYEWLTRLPGSGTAGMLEVRVGRRGPAARDVLAVTAPADDGGEERPAAYRWVLRDVTGTRRTERELSRERELLEGLIDAADVLILLVDGDGRIVRTNAYLQDMTGLPPETLRGRDWCFALLTEEDRPAGRRFLSQARGHGAARTGPLGFRGRSGGVRSVVWSARGLSGGGDSAVVLVGHDITELQDAQVQAVQAERLAAVGQMAAGLAHESRNALQRSQACLSMLGLRLVDRPDVADLLHRAQKAQDDLHRLYEGLLDYAAPVHVEAAPCDLAVAWREAWADLAATGGWAEAELVEDGDPADARCVADCFHLRRVFRNLFENARAAVTGPLRITVGWGPGTLDRRPALRVSIRDNGPGFSPGSRGRLFDAFFTTKVRGTGLGLALCKRVIDEHGGRIEAGPDGPGAEVIITLPRSTS